MYGSEANNWDSTSFPNNTTTDFYNVFIDGGKTGTASTVNLNTSAAVDSVSIDSGDALDVINGRTLTIIQDAGRGNSGRIDNAGSLRLNSTGRFTDIGLIRTTCHSGIGCCPSDLS